MDEDVREFECEGCYEWVEVEVGTWAEENGMCPQCWCEYNGG